MKNSIATSKAISFILLIVMILSFVIPQSVFAEDALPDQEPDAVEESAPAQESAPIVEQPAPAQESAPDEEAVPSEEPAPTQESDPGREANPPEEPAPVQESAPGGETVPSEEPAPSGGPASSPNLAPSTTPFLAQDSTPVEESDTIGFFTPDLGSHTIVQNEGNSYYVAEAEIEGLGQSFRAPFSGTLTKIGTIVAAATYGILKIFSGETAVGDPIHTQDFESGAGINEIILTDPVSVLASHLYTFIFFFGTTTSVARQSTGNSYTDGKLFMTDGVESASSPSEDLTFYVDIAKKKTSASSGHSSDDSEEDNPQANRIIVPVISGQQEAIRCHYASTLLLLPNNDSAEFSGLCGCNGSLNSLQNSGLPGALPAGVVFNSGMTTNLTSTGSPLDLVPGGSVTVRFALPGALTDKTLVLMFWDEGSGKWVEIPLSGSESNFSPSNSLMKVLNGTTMLDGAVQVTVNFMGSFVLAAK